MRGTHVTLAMSDVVGDDLNVDRLGPGVPDVTTWARRRGALTRLAATRICPKCGTSIAGCAGTIPDTPKPGDARSRASQAMVIGSRIDAMAGAARAASNVAIIRS